VGTVGAIKRIKQDAREEEMRQVSVSVKISRCPSIRVRLNYQRCTNGRIMAEFLYGITEAGAPIFQVFAAVKTK